MKIVKINKKPQEPIYTPVRSIEDSGRELLLTKL